MEREGHLFTLEVDSGVLTSNLHTCSEKDNILSQFAKASYEIPQGTDSVVIRTCVIPAQSFFPSTAPEQRSGLHCLRKRSCNPVVRERERETESDGD